MPVINDPPRIPVTGRTSETRVETNVPVNQVNQVNEVAPLSQAGAVGQVNGLEIPEAQKAAVKELRAVMKSGKLTAYYDAAIGYGTDPVLKEKALKLFNALPAINPAAGPEAFVASGLWTTAPRNVEELEKTARYLPGRQVLVKTTVDPKIDGGSSFLAFKEGGASAVTYRARLVGEDGDKFLVKVDGREQPLAVSKAEIFALNQPVDLETCGKVKTEYGTGYKVSDWWQNIADYNSPFMKAKVAEAAVLMEDLVAKLDFSKPQTERAGGAIGAVFGRGKKQEQMVEVQKQCVQIIHDVIDMKYPEGSAAQLSARGRTRSSDCGRAAVRGIGMCREQASVMFAMLQPFGKTLGFDTQFIDGTTYRDIPQGGQPQFGGSAHGWIHVNYRPSTKMFVIDRTWGQCNITADEAYSGRRGDRHPGQLENFATLKAPTATDVRMDGSISVDDHTTQFATRDLSRAASHMSRWQWNENGND